MTKNRKINRNRLIPCDKEGCRLMIRSDKIEGHKRQHDRVYPRGQNGKFIQRNSTVKGTNLNS